MKLPFPSPGSWNDLVANFETLAKLLAGGQAEAISTRGGDNVTWPGGSRLSNPTTVQHKLGRVPRAITFGSSSSNMALSYSNVTASSFDVTGNTIDGTSPAAATARAFSWEAS